MFIPGNNRGSSSGSPLPDDPQIIPCSRDCSNWVIGRLASPGKIKLTYFQQSDSVANRTQFDRFSIIRLGVDRARDYYLVFSVSK